jgi:molybdopterin molybdotransferase
MKRFISYQESQIILDELEVVKYSESIFISAALGRILAEDIVAKKSSPEAPTSGMDGYAIKHEDIENELEVIDINPAGNGEIIPIEDNSTIKTMTGALIPAGADTLVPKENVTIKHGKVIVDTKVPKGFAVREVGENYKCGEIILKKGTLLDFAQIGILASLNIVHVKVYKKPVVSVISTGSEILDLGDIQTNLSQIRSSNHITLEIIANKYGAQAVQQGIVTDNYDEIKESITHALESSDIVVTTGGVSVGDFDFVKDIIIKDLEAEVLFQGVRIKPGGHIVLAKKGNKFILGLPGFAYSSTVTALTYLVPLIQKYLDSELKFATIKAKLLNNVSNSTEKTVFKACNLSYSNGEYYADLTGKKEGTSAILTNLSTATTLIKLYPDDESKEVGEMVDVVVFDNLVR